MERDLRNRELSYIQVKKKKEELLNRKKLNFSVELILHRSITWWWQQLLPLQMGKFFEFTNELELMNSKLCNHFFHLPVIYTHSLNAPAPASLVRAADILQASLQVHTCQWAAIQMGASDFACVLRETQVSWAGSHCFWLVHMYCFQEVGLYGSFIKYSLGIA